MRFRRTEAFSLVPFSVPFPVCSLSERWGKLPSMCLLGLSTAIRCGKQAVAELTNLTACGIPSCQSTVMGMMYQVIPVNSHRGDASLHCKNVEVLLDG